MLAKAKSLLLKSNSKLSKLSKLSRRFIFLSDAPTFDKNPTLHINLPQYNASIDILTLSHWVDIQYFEQNKLNQTQSLHEWIESKSASHILLDIDPNRLDFIYKYNISNPKPQEMTIAEIDEILDIDYSITNDDTYDDEEDNIRNHFYKLRKQTKKMKRFTEKVDRLDEIYKLKLITSANKVSQNKILNNYKLTEPMFTPVDIWYFEFYWNLFQTYFKNLIPHFDEFKREFYLNTNKFRFLNIIYGEEIFMVLNYFDPTNNITINKYNLPKLKGIHSQKNEFDDFMQNNDTLMMHLCNKNNNKNNIELICGGLPIEFIHRKMQKLKKPMLWIEFAMSIKNYFADQHAQNLANQVPLICDIKEFIYTPFARKIKYNSWDSTIELNQMISCVIPQFYDILVSQQSDYLFNNLLKILKQQQEEEKKNKKNIIIITGQGVAQLLNQQILDLLANRKQINKQKN